jgi:hypothetical protein
MIPVIEFTDIGDTKIFVRLDRIESIQDTGGDLIIIRLMSESMYKVRASVFESFRQRILDYWNTLPIVNPGQEKG